MSGSSSWIAELDGAATTGVGGGSASLGVGTGTELAGVEGSTTTGAGGGSASLGVDAVAFLRVALGFGVVVLASDFTVLRRLGVDAALSDEFTSESSGVAFVRLGLRGVAGGSIVDLHKGTGNVANSTQRS